VIALDPSDYICDALKITKAGGEELSAKEDQTSSAPTYASNEVGPAGV
jgi:hypothetical protein